jgi:hypothetical protein
MHLQYPGVRYLEIRSKLLPACMHACIYGSTIYATMRWFLDNFFSAWLACLKKY